MNGGIRFEPPFDFEVRCGTIAIISSFPDAELTDPDLRAFKATPYRYRTPCVRLSYHENFLLVMHKPDFAVAGALPPT